MLQFIIQKIFLWAGMASRSRIGCSSCTDWASSTNAKYAGTFLIGEEERLKCISRNGGTLMVWDAWRSQTLCTSEISPRSVMQLPYTRNWPEKAKMPSSGQTWKNSSKTMKVTFSTEELTWIWKNKVSFDYFFSGSLIYYMLNWVYLLFNLAMKMNHEKNALNNKKLDEKVSESWSSLSTCVFGVFFDGGSSPSLSLLSLHHVFSSFHYFFCSLFKPLMLLFVHSCLIGFLLDLNLFFLLHVSLSLHFHDT